MTVHVCPPEHKHARNLTCYSSHKCRCGSCRKASAAVSRARRAAKPMPSKPRPRISEEQKLDILDLVYRVKESTLSVPLKEYAEDAALDAVLGPPPERAEAKDLISALTSLLTITAKGATA